MSSHNADSDGLLPMVGDIVERNVYNAPPSNGPSLVGESTAAAAPSPPLRPIQAVIGQAFPVLRTRHAYGRLRESTLPSAASLPVQRHSTATTSSVRDPTANFSAHVQPQDGASGERDGLEMHGGGATGLHAMRLHVPEGGTEAVLPAGGSAQQRLPAHQWSASEFEELQSGYYVAAPASSAGPAASTAVGVASPPRRTGEDFFGLLFQCLRSTVRKHQQLALEVLLQHLCGLSAAGCDSASSSPLTNALEEARGLRERCLHGPNCGPFLFFLLEILVSAGHPAMVELAATTLLLLLRGLTRGGSALDGSPGAAATGAASGLLDGSDDVSVLAEAIGELGNPAGDVGEEDADEEGSERAAPRRTGSDGSMNDKEKGGAADTPVDDPELPFSAVSELLRGADARYGLEQLGFTNKVLAAMQLLLYSDAPVRADADAHHSIGEKDEANTTMSSATAVRTSSSSSLSPCHAEVVFLELLLCGGVGVGQRAACRRVAEDPHFLSWVEAHLSTVVLGQRQLADLVELLCVMQHLAHCPTALRSLLRGGVTSTDAGAAVPSTTSTATQRTAQRFHETWLLFFLFVSSTAVSEVRSVRHASAIVWAMLLLRLCVHHGRRSSSSSYGHGLVYDMSDTLLTEGMQVGGGLVLEMWYLHYTHAEAAAATTAMAAAEQQGSLDTFFLDAARTALRLCQCDGATPASAAQRMGASLHNSDAAHAHQSASSLAGQAVSTHEAVAAQRLLLTFRWIASAHFIATYVREVRQRRPAVCYTLSGSAVATQETMQHLVRHVVMDAGRMSTAFARFTTPLLSPSFHDVTAVVDASRISSLEHSDEVCRVASAGVQQQLGWVPAVHAIVCRWKLSVTDAMDTPRSGGPPAEDDHFSQQAGASAASPPSVSALSARGMRLLDLAFEAAALFANTRLAVSLAEVYPAVAKDAVLGYAGMLTHAFEEACLRLRDGAAVRLQVDELCTMAEAVQALQRLSSGSAGGTPAAASQAVIETSNQSALRAPATTSKPATSSSPPPPPPLYAREARLGAFFLLHSIAISKHCLDVVPHILPLLQPRITTGAATAAAQSVRATSASADVSLPPLIERMALLASLQIGIEVTLVPMMLSSGGTAGAAAAATPAAVAVSGAPRSWVLYPLYDTAFTAKAAWAQWLRGLLGLHRRVKDVVGWDAVLSHTLLWTLAHRRELWSAPTAPAVAEGLATAEQGENLAAEESEVISATSAAAALCGLLVGLCAVLHDHSSHAGGRGVSGAASRTLEISLTAYSDVSSEEGLPLLLHAVLAYVAAHCTARAALAALQVLLVTPITTVADTDTNLAGELATCDLVSGSSSTATATGAVSCASPAPSSYSYCSTAAQVCDWLRRWSQAQTHQTQSATSAHWSLQDVVALVQLAGPYFHNFQGGAGDIWNSEAAAPGSALAPAGHREETEQLWCARCLVDGLLAYYLQQRRATSGDLSMMEKLVLRSTLEELNWYPAVLWPHLDAA